MQYQGGKGRIAQHLARVMLSEAAERGRYVEPFLGGASVAALMVPRFAMALLADASPDLIEMWSAVAAGWEPPDDVSEMEYAELRHAPPSALRGFVGYGCSFGGKFFGGYARDDRKSVSFATTARRGCQRKAQAFRSASFRVCDYSDLEILPGDVVYCDPPYAGTTGYRHGDFDVNRFDACARRWAALGAHVFLSEYRAPSDAWQRIWRRPVAQHIGTAGGGSQVAARMEGLYTLNFPATPDSTNPVQEPRSTA